MTDFISLSCPSCGAKLEITEDIERFSCSHCGKEHIVRRGGGIVSISPIVTGLKDVKVGVDKTVSELALIRLKNEKDKLENEIDETIKDFNSEGKGLYKWAVIIGFVSIWIGISNSSALGVIVGVGFIAYIFFNEHLRQKKLNNGTSNLQLEIENIDKEISKHKKIIQE